MNNSTVFEKMIEQSQLVLMFDKQNFNSKKEKRTLRFI